MVSQLLYWLPDFLNYFIIGTFCIITITIRITIWKVLKLLEGFSSSGDENGADKYSNFNWTCYKSLSRHKWEKEKKQERLVILGMLINIHELLSLASILIITGLLSTVSSKLESAIVKEHRRVSLCCIIVLSKHMIGYWFFVKGCRLDRILSSQGPSLPGITSLSRFFSFSRFCRERDLLQVQISIENAHISIQLLHTIQVNMQSC